MGKLILLHKSFEAHPINSLEFILFHVFPESEVLNTGAGALKDIVFCITRIRAKLDAMEKSLFEGKITSVE